MPVDLERSHWSRPGAIRTLQALRKFGGAATTWQIAEVTHSVCVHSDIHCVRCFCEEEGICPADEAVVQEYAGMTDSRRRVSLYRLDERVSAALRAGWAAEDEMVGPGPGIKPSAPAGRRAGRPGTPAAGAHPRSSGATGDQAVLFDTLLPPYLRPH